MAAKDIFSSVTAKSAPGEDIFSITPHDTNELEFTTRGICFGTEGALKVMTVSGRIVTIPSGVLAAGIIHPLRVKMVYSTDTTAADIYGVV